MYKLLESWPSRF